jgi:hypothetical protein
LLGSVCKRYSTHFSWMIPGFLWHILSSKLEEVCTHKRSPTIPSCKGPLTSPIQL